jgi:hypothetical protein
VLGYLILIEGVLHFVNHNSSCGESSLHLSSIFLFHYGELMHYVLEMILWILFKFCGLFHGQGFIDAH